MKLNIKLFIMIIGIVFLVLLNYFILDNSLFNDSLVIKPSNDVINLNNNENVKVSPILVSYEDELLEFTNVKVSQNDMVVYGINIGMTVGNLINKINTNGELSILDKDNNLLDDGKLKTGDKIQVLFSNRIDEYKISVLGDTNGDGICNVNDVVKVARHIVDKEVIEQIEYLIASDIDSVNDIDINDVIKLTKYLNGEYSFEEQDKVVSVTGISLDKTEDEIYLNSNDKTISLKANVEPSNASDKSVIWSSSDEGIANVDENGVVTGSNPGVVTISATTVDGEKMASVTIEVRKKIIIVIGASQVWKMYEHKKSYSSLKYNYSVSDKTLVYVYASGSEIDYQTGTGFTNAKDNTITTYDDVKDYIDFHIFFPLSGNTIRDYKCSDILTTNTKIQAYAKNYNDAIQSLKDSDYNVFGYVVSMHPVTFYAGQTVENEYKGSCDIVQRSNLKYYTFNLVMESLLESYTDNLAYLELFTSIVEVNDEGKNYPFKVTYKTADGVHWLYETTQMYVDMMFDSAGNL